MATIKQWSSPQAATVKFDVALTMDGNIAQSGDTAAGKKTFSMPGIKTNADLAAAKTVYSAFVTGLAGGRYDDTTGKKVVEYSVVEVEEEEP